MDSMYQIKTQKTYKGKTAGGWLKMAEVEQCKAGIPCIWVSIPRYGYCQVDLADDGDMIIADSEGILCCLETSKKAYRTLKALEAKQNDECIKIARKGGYY
jgi:hypothetical protein